MKPFRCTRPLPGTGVLLCVALLACSADPNPSRGYSPYPQQPQVDANNSQNAGNLVGDLQVAQLERPAVDASTLKVTGLTVTPTRAGQLRLGSVGYQATGTADFVEIQACSAGVCTSPEKVYLNRHVLKALSPGRATVKVRACVEQKRAKDPGVLCGSWETTEFTQPRQEDARMLDLLSEREQKEAELTNLTNRFTSALKKFEKDAGACIAAQRDAERMTLMKNMVSNFLAIGDGLITKAIGTASVNVSVPVAPSLSSATLPSGTTPTQPAAVSPTQPAQGTTDSGLSVSSSPVFGANPAGVLNSDNVTFSTDPSHRLSTYNSNSTSTNASLLNSGVTTGFLTTPSMPATDMGTPAAQGTPTMQGTPAGTTGTPQSGSPATNNQFPNMVGNQPITNTQPLVDPLEKLKKRMQGFNNFNSSVTDIASTLGFFKAAEPMPALQTFGTAIFNLFSAKNANPAVCIAEETARAELQAIAALREQIAQRVIYIDAKIKEGSPQ